MQLYLLCSRTDNLIVSCSKFIIIDLLEITCNSTPFIFTSYTIPHLSGEHCIHNLCWNFVPFCNNNFKFASHITSVKACHMLFLFGFDKCQNFIMLPIWLVGFAALNLLHIGTKYLVGCFLIFPFFFVGGDTSSLKELQSKNCSTPTHRKVWSMFLFYIYVK